MKVVILAAGYGTRFIYDIENDSSGKYDDLKALPKALLPIGNICLLDIWMEHFQSTKSIDEICVVVNSLHEHFFIKWASAWPKVRLICDGSISNETRKGAIKCMKLGIDHFKENDDVIVLAGDTLFSRNFPILDVIDTFYFHKKCDENSSVCLLISTNCPNEEVHKRGIIETDESSRVISFKEKPKPHETASRKQCPCFYILSKESLPLVDEFLKANEHKALQCVDAPGNFIADLVQKATVYSYHVPKRFDVGGLSTYIECCSNYSEIDMSP